MRRPRDRLGGLPEVGDTLLAEGFAGQATLDIISMARSAAPIERMQ